MLILLEYQDPKHSSLIDLNGVNIFEKVHNAADEIARCCVKQV